MMCPTLLFSEPLFADDRLQVRRCSLLARCAWRAPLVRGPRSEARRGELATRGSLRPDRPRGRAGKLSTQLIDITSVVWPRVP